MLFYKSPAVLAGALKRHAQNSGLDALTGIAQTQEAWFESSSYSQNDPDFLKRSQNEQVAVFNTVQGNDGFQILFLPKVTS